MPIHLALRLHGGLQGVLRPQTRPSRLVPWALSGLLGAMALPAPAQPVSTSVRAGLATDWMLRGIRLSYGQSPVFFAGADVYAASGSSAGAGAMSLRDDTDSATQAWLLRAGQAWRLGDADTLAAELQHNDYRHSTSLARWSGTQAALGWSHDDRWSLTWNLDRPRDASLRADSLDAALHWALAPHLALNASAGRAWHAPLGAYGYAQAGVGVPWGPWQMQLAQTWVDAGARRRFGDAARPRWVASVQWSD